MELVCKRLKTEKSELLVNLHLLGKLERQVNDETLHEEWIAVKQSNKACLLDRYTS